MAYQISDISIFQEKYFFFSSLLFFNMLILGYDDFILAVKSSNYVMIPFLFPQKIVNLTVNLHTDAFTNTKAIELLLKNLYICTYIVYFNQKHYTTSFYSFFFYASKKVCYS